MRKLKRFVAACFAMNGMLANKGAYYQCMSDNNPYENLGGFTTVECAEFAYKFADELLKQENK